MKERLKKYYGIIYEEKNGLLMEERMYLAKECMKGLMEESERERDFVEESKKYIRERSKEEERMGKVEREVIKEMKGIKVVDKGSEIVRASSYSGGIWMKGESDVDVGLLFGRKEENRKRKELGEYLRSKGYEKKEERQKGSESYYEVYVKEKYGVEVEVKLRTREGFVEIRKRHEYLERKIGKEEKRIMTYLKVKAKKMKGKVKGKSYYTVLKTIMNDYIGYLCKSKGIITF